MNPSVDTFSQRTSHNGHQKTMPVATRWPTAVDYQTALQTPTLCFKDPALKQGDVHTNALGLPMAATGNVVVVFRMSLGRDDVALRCFTRKVQLDSLVRRYDALNRHLKKNRLSALVQTQYRPDELLIDEDWFPVIQMPWLQGLPLHRYIEQHLDEPGVLNKLADQWKTLMGKLAGAKFAHGDLSDGNVLVDADGRINLIDYDAAYVPELQAEPPSEVGKPNYQHPERLDLDAPGYGYYAANVDAFPALLIYLTLRALAEDASRWECYHTGENLIFTQDDFKNPGYTPIWLDLKNGESEEVKRLCDVFESFCLASVVSLPDLKDALRGKMPSRRRREVAEQPVADYAADTYEPYAADPVADEPVLVEAAPAVRTRTMYIVGGGALAVIAVLLVLLVRGLMNEPSGTINMSPSSEMTTAYLVPESLPGFYSGYATSLDGEREPMALTIDSLEVFSDIREAFFTYSVNWKSHQARGLGRYNMDTGHVDLENHYILYVARATDDEIVLSSLSHRDERPLVMVNKRLTQ